MDSNTERLLELRAIRNGKRSQTLAEILKMDGGTVKWISLTEDCRTDLKDWVEKALNDLSVPYKIRQESILVLGKQIDFAVSVKEKCDCGKCGCEIFKDDGYASRVLQSHNTSGFRGVRKKYEGRAKNWVAEVTQRGKRVTVGSYHTAVEAARARNMYIDAHNLDLVKNP